MTKFFDPTLASNLINDTTYRNHEVNVICNHFVMNTWGLKNHFKSKNWRSTAENGLILCIEKETQMCQSIQKWTK